MAWLIDYPREKVNWSPIVDLSKCLKCGICMNCGKQVYTWTKEGPVVEAPLDCGVGCTTCRNLCKGEAISFPDKHELRSLYEREKLWAKVTRQMKKDGKMETKNI